MRIWDTDREPAHSSSSRAIEYHSRGVAALHWTPVGLASASWDSHIALWRISEDEDISLVDTVSFGELNVG